MDYGCNIKIFAQCSKNQLLCDIIVQSTKRKDCQWPETRTICFQFEFHSIVARPLVNSESCKGFQ